VFRKLLPLVPALVLACVFRADARGGRDDKPANDPDAKFTLKLRDEKAGDKTEHTETEKGTADITLGGKSEKEQQNKKLEYTETISEMPANGGKPTKLTRTYKTAQKYDKKAGELKPLPYEGKTVTIEKKTKGYQFSLAESQFTDAEVPDLVREFSKPSKTKSADFLPKKAVKVGESWTLDEATLKAFGAEVPFALDLSKSKMTGKLTRVYTKDDKQWGVIALDFDLVLDPNAGPKYVGAIKLSGTLDAVVDGSARDGTVTMHIKITVTGGGAGQELKVVADAVSTKTVKTLK
jgi:hypothetical protein